MVLTKRKRDGEFVVWAPSRQVSDTSVVPERPAKKARTKTTDSYPPSTAAACSFSNWEVPSVKSAIPTASHVSANPPAGFADELPQPGPSQAPKAARSRKKADAGAPKPEKRGAIFKRSCPRNILDRVERVRTPQREITANILALLNSELEQIFCEAPLAPNSVAHPRVREAHARATGKATVPAQSPPKKRIPGPDDDCPICYDGMDGVNETMLVFCEDCGNALHKQCFEEWRKNCTASGKDFTCVWCRARWTTGSAAGSSKGVRSAEGYLNLSGVSGLSPVRDTSSYYNGPRRGQRYNGFQSYLDD
ncbi:hypothetical protein DXG03_008575 [Asterophora parasitica]|uniref:RING-type domain-containing protein n=1 Tax=Asterophora parasitica TaxID=117018 RepID=A0A9P7G6E9_9AGAR|nr:hypothetical protein DXG03_008575 [Asterophora parasitica]